jgi:1,4-dihydroxy-2-naphthoate octaprenyltransferase
LLASRPKTLPAAVAPVVVGTAVAFHEGGLRPGPALAALAGALLLQVGSNFANDVFDHEKGADREGRLGPVRAVQAGLLTPAQMRRGLVVVFGLAVLAGCFLVHAAGWPVVAIGLASIASAVAYTGGPWPLGYHGLGDVFVFVFFGLVAVCGTAFVQLLRVPALAWWAAVPVGLLTTAILVVNNERDRESDAAAGKRTLAVRLGRRGSLAEYLTLLLGAFAVPVALVVTGRAGAPLLLPLLASPLALQRARRVTADQGAALNPSLAGTAQLLLAYSLLLALGIALDA